MITKKGNFIYINEDGRKEDCQKWNSKIEKLLLNKDVVFIYPNSLDVNLKQALYQFSIDMSQSNNKGVLVYEQELGRGGDACAINSLLSVGIYFLAPIIINISYGFLQEFGKDIYDRSLKLIFRSSREDNKYYIGTLFLITKIDDYPLEYIYLNHHTELEKKEAYDAILYHMASIDKSLLRFDINRFVWDRTKKIWTSC